MSEIALSPEPASAGPDLSPAQRLVLLDLEATFDGRGGGPYPLTEAIARTGLSRRTITRALEALSAKLLIIHWPGQGNVTTQVYLR